MTDNNLVWAISKAVETLTSHKTLGKKTQEKSLMLKLLIHFYGDLHQPLHNAALFNDSLIDGD